MNKNSRIYTLIAPKGDFNFCRQVSFLPTFVALVFFGCQPKWEIRNPYQDVDWGSFLQYKANLHTHSTISDGSMSPQAVVDLYHQNDYTILSITDHNNVSYPWEKFAEMQPSQLCSIRNAYALSGVKPENPSYESRGITPEALIFENRDPSSLGMVSIQGNEITLNKSHDELGKHDMGSYFSDHSDLTITGEETLQAIAEKNGIAMFMHPGRYNFSIQWYLRLYRKYSCLKGMELYNGGEIRCIEIWDSLLVNMMPERPVWGFSNDDTHTINHFGRNWNMFILPELSEDWVRRGIEQGLLFFVSTVGEKTGSSSSVPEIKSIEVQPNRGIISIRAEGQDSIAWVSGGKTVSRGEQVVLDRLPEGSNYVRAVLFGNSGKMIVGTQPFGIKKLYK